MSIGTIIYYILWPIVGIAIAVNWFFSAISFLFGLCTELVMGFHEEIKEL